MKTKGKSKKSSEEPDWNERIFKSLKRLGLTEEDMRLLEGHLRPLRDKPYELGLPHFLALIKVREDAERFWYQEKAQNQGLSLRQLEQTMSENLFYKILGTTPPGPPKLGRKQPPPQVHDDAFHFGAAEINAESVHKMKAEARKSKSKTISKFEFQKNKTLFPALEFLIFGFVSNFGI